MDFRGEYKKQSISVVTDLFSIVYRFIVCCCDSRSSILRDDQVNLETEFPINYKSLMNYGKPLESVFENINCRTR